MKIKIMYCLGHDRTNPVYARPTEGNCPHCGGFITTATAAHNGSLLDECAECGALFDYLGEEEA